MSYEGTAESLDYYPCRYGKSRTVFRGPAISMDKPFIAVIGGSEVYGKYVEDPFTDQLSERTAYPVMNLGVRNAGIDVFTSDDELGKVFGQAKAVVVQTLNAQNMSNRYYTVHARRNDRFLRQSPLMDALYPDVDFSEFSFTRHMLATLRARSPERFVKIEDEFRAAWVARMRLLLSHIPGRRILLHIGLHQEHDLGPEPLFVSRDMMEMLEPSHDGLVECDVADTFTEDRVSGMAFRETERDSAKKELPPAAHERVAATLSAVFEAEKGLAA